MTINLPQRRNSLRYPNYDYSQPGSVFVTICTHERQRLFGQVADGQMRLNSGGHMVELTLGKISRQFPGCTFDTWVVMPDHIHAIIHSGTNPESEIGQSLGAVIRWFKSTTVEAWRIGVRDSGWPRYDRHLWQPDYFDRIIRNDRQIDVDREYIDGNPGRWWEKYGNNLPPS